MGACLFMGTPIRGYCQFRYTIFVARGEKTQRVQELVEQLGISERTAWRWLARQPGLEAEDLVSRPCRGCGAPLPEEATIRRNYCDSTCRVYAHRRRKAWVRTAELRDAKRGESQA
jgi:hypothetical protein